ncbi:MAG: hypothetical protein WCF95_05340 [bacterium]
MVNGYINSQQIQPQVYQRQQAQPPIQVVQNDTQEQIQNVQPSDVVPYQYQNPMYAPRMDAFSTHPASASGVSINIISPSVYGANRAEIPYSPIYSYPAATTMPQAPIPPAPQATANATAQATVSTPAAITATPTVNKTKEKTIVPLTNEYIQTLENYIKNPNEQVRIMGVQEVMARFKEDESRRNDAALTALLNTSLQDKSSKVRVIGMTTVAAGYSAGDKNTANALNKIQQSKSNYNEDALLAANALMKMSSDPQKVQVPEN